MKIFQKLNEVSCFKVGKCWGCEGRLRFTRRKAGPVAASRSLNVLKKSEKGLLTEYQRSFSFWKKSSATGRCFTE
jgi:hypothetical protein